MKIAYFYPELLNLYGDNGNVEILSYRAKKRGIDVKVIRVGLDTKLDSNFMSEVDVVFMGGGPDSSQKAMYKDLKQEKGPYLKEYILSGGVGIFICGSYQLLGNYYKASDGLVLEGLGIFDLHTEHFGKTKPRCIGNTVAQIEKTILEDEYFKSVNRTGDLLVGFENHGGRTYLSKNLKPFARVVMGHGNNSEDGTEGVVYKNAIGTYFHGPILARNPHLADYLIAKSLGRYDLVELDDKLIIAAHTASRKLKQ